MKSALLILLLVAIFACQSETDEKPNLIVLENQQEGTTNWLLTNVKEDSCPPPDHPYCRRPAIEGYCNLTSVSAGQAIDVFVSTDPASDFTVDVYRMGYYGGKGGRLMKSFEPIAGKVQPVPEDGELKVRECKWEKSLTIDIPEDWLSGVYLGKMTALNDSSQAYIIFIVKDNRKADILFQCSDNTWQAYNRWPAWRSLYDWEDNIWHTSIGADVSFDRPYITYYNGLPMAFNPLTNGSGEFLLWEFPLAFWMEKEGFDVSYISNLDTHRDYEGLLRAKGFLSVGHDEYWSRQMYENVSLARDEGLNLAFLSGNSVDGTIGYKPSFRGQPLRVFGRVGEFEDEQELMGGSSYGVGFTSWKCVKPDHWIFENTGMQMGDSIAGLVGWEFHGYPLGKMDDLEIVAEKPLERWDESKIHAATVYYGPKGNFVFDAGTCWWSLPLSSPPGFQNPPDYDFSQDDPRVQQITRNILNRMAAFQPEQP